MSHFSWYRRVVQGACSSMFGAYASQVSFISECSSCEHRSKVRRDTVDYFGGFFWNTRKYRVSQKSLAFERLLLLEYISNDILKYLIE